jgi:hypothetical protein
MTHNGSIFPVNLPPHSCGLVGSFIARAGPDVKMEKKKNSDTGNRTPSYRVRGGNVNRYTISDNPVDKNIHQ